jgi:hypothetical protein
MARGVIAPKVSDVRGCLIHVGARCGVLALELDDNDARSNQKDRVWTPRFEWQFVFQNRGVLGCGVVAREQLADLSLEVRNRIVPGADLLWARIPNKSFEMSSDYAGLRSFESR